MQRDIFMPEENWVPRSRKVYSEIRNYMDAQELVAHLKQMATEYSVPLENIDVDGHVNGDLVVSVWREKPEEEFAAEVAAARERDAKKHG